MAKKHEKICTVCGNHYQYCNSCAQYASLPLWKSAFCSEECMKIFDIAGRYNFGEYDKAKAKELLEELGVSENKKYESSGINKVIKEIYNIEKSVEEVKEEKPTVVEKVKSVKKAKDVKKDTSAPQKVTEEKSKVSEYVNATKKRSYKKNKE